MVERKVESMVHWTVASSAGQMAGPMVPDMVDKMAGSMVGWMDMRSVERKEDLTAAHLDAETVGLSVPLTVEQMADHWDSSKVESKANSWLVTKAPLTAVTMAPQMVAMKAVSMVGSSAGQWAGQMVARMVASTALAKVDTTGTIPAALKADYSDDSTAE